jgi:hypothetical protein
MTENERKEIDAWIDTSRKLQPTGTLAIFIYTRDGLVQVGRGDQPLELNQFLLDDLPIAEELIITALTQAYENGVPETADIA